MTVAFDLLLATYRKMGTMLEGSQYVASAGGTTTCTCAALTETADNWNGGCLLIITDKGGAGAAPEKESRDISDFGATIATVGTAFSTAVAAGDLFGITTPEFPRSQVYRVLDEALQWYGPIPQEDVTTLDTAAATLEYALPAAAIYDLRQVWIQGSTSTPYDWQMLSYWHVDYQAGLLLFEVQPPSIYGIKLVYYAPHAALTGDAIAVSSFVSNEAIVWYAYAGLLHYSMQATGRDTTHRTQMLNDARQMADALRRQKPIPYIPKSVGYAYIPDRKMPPLRVKTP